MTAVITGDIINSREAKASSWLPLLKKVLGQYGEEPETWEIFRGDSFQLEISPKEALKAAIHIKSTIKQVANLDVRLAIGIGEKNHAAKRITQSNGSAFVNSGECFDNLKKQTMAIQSPKKEIDERINLLLALALLTMNTWGTVTSSVIKTALENPKKNQTELAKLLHKSQSSISEALKRAGYEEIMRLEKQYRTLIQSL